jgi:hypothetical protein
MLAAGVAVLAYIVPKIGAVLADGKVAGTDFGRLGGVKGALLSSGGGFGRGRGR